MAFFGTISYKKGMKSVLVLGRGFFSKSGSFGSNPYIIVPCKLDYVILLVMTFLLPGVTWKFFMTASNAGLIDAEGLNASIDEKTSGLLIFWAIKVKNKFY